MKVLATSITLSLLLSFVNGELKHHRHAIHNDAQKLQKRSKQCEFPANVGLVSVTPNEQNAGWAMSPDQPCKPGMYCPYACPAGQVGLQWDPKATSYSYPISQNGGLYCNENGEIEKPFPEKDYCANGVGSAVVNNTCGGVVSFCQTVLPGNEAMLIPTEVHAGMTEIIAVPDPSYWVSTAAHYYINAPGVGIEEGCVWGTKQNPIGNWSPYVAGANADASGNTFVKIGWNPVYLESDCPFKNTLPTFGIRLVCDGSCVGLPCEINPKFNGVNEVTSSLQADGAGGGAFCVGTAQPGSHIYIEVFEVDGNSNTGSLSSTQSQDTDKLASFGDSSNNDKKLVQESSSSQGSIPESTSSSQASTLSSDSTTSSDAFTSSPEPSTSSATPETTSSPELTSSGISTSSYIESSTSSGISTSSYIASSTSSGISTSSYIESSTSSAKPSITETSTSSFETSTSSFETSTSSFETSTSSAESSTSFVESSTSSVKSFTSFAESSTSSVKLSTSTAESSTSSTSFVESTTSVMFTTSSAKPTTSSEVNTSSEPTTSSIVLTTSSIRLSSSIVSTTSLSVQSSPTSKNIQSTSTTSLISQAHRDASSEIIISRTVQNLKALEATVTSQELTTYDVKSVSSLLSESRSVLYNLASFQNSTTVSSQTTKAITSVSAGSETSSKSSGNAAVAPLAYLVGFISFVIAALL